MLSPWIPTEVLQHHDLPAFNYLPEPVLLDLVTADCEHTLHAGLLSYHCHCTDGPVGIQRCHMCKHEASVDGDEGKVSAKCLLLHLLCSPWDS